MAKPKAAMEGGNSTMRRNGSILVGLLWCVVLLSLMVIGVLHTARMDLLLAKNYGDRIQAHYLALAGVEKAKALLYQDARDRSRNGRNHSGQLYDDAGQFRDMSFGRGVFRVFRRGRQDENGGVIYGVSDEESRLNVNEAATNQLMKLDGMTPDVAAAIVDWRGSGGPLSAGGAGPDYYASLQPPYLPRNGAFQTVRELLMVRGITPELLLGNDRTQNGFFDPDEEVAANATRSGGLAADVDAGWAASMTVDSMIDNVSASGQERINAQDADESALSGVPGISPAIAHSIAVYRNQNRLNSLADLLDVPAAQNRNGGRGNSGGNQGGSGRSGSSGRGGSQASSSGPKVIDQTLLQDIADDLTLNSAAQLPGIINVNTAGLDVLLCVPGIDRQLAQAIISYRQSTGYLPNIAWLLNVPGMTRDVFKEAAPYLDARSETFRILSEGQVKSTGIRQRVQEIVHVGLNDVTTVSYREDGL
jgi:DNA uptake protein ComE-like DNA-binding protein